MINILSNGMFDFLEIFLIPLWGIVAVTFFVLVFVVSKTIISDAKKKQKGIKTTKTRYDYIRDIEPYTEMATIKITFDGKAPVYSKVIDEVSITNRITDITTDQK